MQLAMINERIQIYHIITPIYNLQDVNKSIRALWPESECHYSSKSLQKFLHSALSLRSAEDYLHNALSHLLSGETGSSLTKNFKYRLCTPWWNLSYLIYWFTYRSWYTFLSFPTTKIFIYQITWTLKTLLIKNRFWNELKSVKSPQDLQSWDHCVVFAPWTKRIINTLWTTSSYAKITPETIVSFHIVSYFKTTLSCC